MVTAITKFALNVDAEMVPAMMGTIGMFGILCLTIQRRFGLGIPRLKMAKRPLGLVLSPEGIALAQGEIEGMQIWGDVTGFSQSTTGVTSGLRLQFDRSEIVLADVYTCPLQIIEELILWYLKDNNGRW